jgi:hypothetical protein
MSIILSGDKNYMSVWALLKVNNHFSLIAPSYKIYIALSFLQHLVPLLECPGTSVGN